MVTTHVDATDEYLNHQQNVSKLAELRLIQDYANLSYGNSNSEEQPLDLVNYSHKTPNYTEDTSKFLASSFQYQPEIDVENSSGKIVNQTSPKRSLTSCVDSILSLKFKQKSFEHVASNEKVVYEKSSEPT